MTDEYEITYADVKAKVAAEAEERQERLRKQIKVFYWPFFIVSFVASVVLTSMAFAAHNDNDLQYQIGGLLVSAVAMTIFAFLLLLWRYDQVD